MPNSQFKTGFFSQFSDAQIKNQYAENAKGLKTMHEKAKATGKKVNNFTADQLKVLSVKFENLAK